MGSDGISWPPTRVRRHARMSAAEVYHLFTSCAGVFERFIRSARARARSFFIAHRASVWARGWRWRRRRAPPRERRCRWLALTTCQRRRNGGAAQERADEPPRLSVVCVWRRNAGGVAISPHATMAIPLEGARSVRNVALPADPVVPSGCASVPARRLPLADRCVPRLTDHSSEPHSAPANGSDWQLADDCGARRTSARTPRVVVFPRKIPSAERFGVEPQVLSRRALRPRGPSNNPHRDDRACDVIATRECSTSERQCTSSGQQGPGPTTRVASVCSVFCVPQGVQYRRHGGPSFRIPQRAGGQGFHGSAGTTTEQPHNSTTTQQNHKNRRS